MKYLSIKEPPTLGDFLRVCSGLPVDEIRQIEALSGVPYSDEAMAALLFTTRRGISWAIRDETDRALVVCGATEETPGMWSVWYLARQEAWTGYGEEVTDITRALMQSMFLDFHARRLEVRCLANREKARHWYERHLGLEYEGTLRAVGVNGEDVALYAKVRES